MSTGFWSGNLRERDHWGNPDRNGRIILRWMEVGDVEGFWWVILRVRDLWGGPDVHGRIILR
jgi:hypothetical protein